MIWTLVDAKTYNGGNNGWGLPFVTAHNGWLCAQSPVRLHRRCDLDSFYDRGSTFRLKYFLNDEAP